jgi:hypothetical protein
MACQANCIGGWQQGPPGIREEVLPMALLKPLESILFTYGMLDQDTPSKIIFKTFAIFACPGV